MFAMTGAMRRRRSRVARPPFLRSLDVISAMVRTHQPRRAAWGRAPVPRVEPTDRAIHQCCRFRGPAMAETTSPQASSGVAGDGLGKRRKKIYVHKLAPAAAWPVRVPQADRCRGCAHAGNLPASMNVWAS